jgi:hypothetical protein
MTYFIESAARDDLNLSADLGGKHVLHAHDVDRVHSWTHLDDKIEVTVRTILAACDGPKDGCVKYSTRL